MPELDPEPQTAYIQPLLVHLIFHPKSVMGKLLAEAAHQILSDDPLVPGLKIPTVYTRLDNGAPPTLFPYAEHKAERHFSIIFSDVNLAADLTWCDYVSKVWLQSTGDTNQCCIPVQCDEQGWPLTPELSGTNFVRALDDDIEITKETVIRHMLIELCRFLDPENIDSNSPGAPTRMFISHTKLDVKSEPYVVDKLKQYLSIDQPVKAWFDSGDIPSGSSFSQQIEEGVDDSSLLCVLTDNYTSREWCRKEILWAKEKSRPIVVINALTGSELRSFPYLGNVPVLRWDNRPEFAVDTLLKETLRHLHVKLSLDHFKKGGKQVLACSPELLSLRKIRASSRVIYPDPPLSKEELGILSDTGVVLLTPLELLAQHSPLSNKTIALSMSGSTDIEQYGFSAQHLEQFMLSLSGLLILKGATLLFGGHMGDEGYTDKLAELVRAHQPDFIGVNKKVLINYVGWPVPENIRKTVSYRPVADIQYISRPDTIVGDIPEAFVETMQEYISPALSAEHRFAWAQGMTHLREKLVRDSATRIVIGGNIGPTSTTLPDGSINKKWYSGSMPGVLEEVLLSIDAGQPVFLLGAFGGAAAAIVDLIEDKERRDLDWDEQSKAPHSEKLRALYLQHQLRWPDYEKIKYQLSNLDVQSLNPLLSKSDCSELFQCSDPYRCIQIIVKGLGNL